MTAMTQLINDRLAIRQLTLSFCRINSIDIFYKVWYNIFRKNLNGSTVNGYGKSITFNAINREVYWY